ncbi:hypothetical protein KKC45_00690 [Patescibacteria group bacterium]|nr:hypothetical protein [Patescibacteria group bacterium]
MKEETRLTSFRLGEYPHFINKVTEIVLKKIDPQVRDKVSVVVGISNLGIDIVLAYNVAVELNKERNKNSCRAVYCKRSKFSIINFVNLHEGFAHPKTKDFVLFVHCGFEDPQDEKFYGNLQALKKQCTGEFILSELLQNKKERSWLVKNNTFHVDSCIILPPPIQEYRDFIRSIS